MALSTQLLREADLDRNYGTYEKIAERPSYQANFHKTISLAGDQKSSQFWYDCRGMEKNLIYQGTTVRDKYSDLYQKLEQAEAASAVVREQIEELESEPGSSSEEGVERQAQLEMLKKNYDELEGRVDHARHALFGNGAKKGPIWRDLRKFLQENLSDRKKEDVIDEVTWRFSQNAVVNCFKELNEFTTKKFGGIFMAPPGEVADIQTCTLDVQRGAAKITAHAKQRFSQFYRTTGEIEQLEKPVVVDAVMEMNVKPRRGLFSRLFSCCSALPVKTTANVDINIQEVGV